ncbi:MAG: FxLYD domain-containing protein [Deltaproteobacteria bacterium]|jgi:hypothetical protein|nr:FxLYD domain-containing protein [Deltaproteobacteria bacterium]
MNAPITFKVLKRAAFLALAVLMAAALGGCVSMGMPDEKQEPITADVAEMSANSMNVAVTNYSWYYINANNHVNIMGTVVNQSGAPINGAAIVVMLYDQNGKPFAQGDSYVRPTYIKDGGTGTFEFMAMAKKPKGVTATRLVYSVRPQAAY